MPKNPEKKISIPENVNIDIEGRTIRIRGPAGENSLTIKNIAVGLKKDEKSLILFAKGNFTKKEKRVINANASHIRNMIKGSLEPYTYKLRICSGHFPMSVSVEKNRVVIKNFLGEKVPRTAKIVDNSDVKINGDQIFVTCVNKETAGQTAANIEQSTRITNKDRRVFQDGIYIIEKGGKPVA